MVYVPLAFCIRCLAIQDSGGRGSGEVRRILVTRTLKRHWVPLVFVVVLAVSGVLIARLHKVFASADLNANAGAGVEIVQFNPKYIGYEAFGPPGTTADINYWDAEANVHQLNDVPSAATPRPSAW
jgi:hypothetical protein